MQRLHEAGIATRPGTHAPHMLGFYSNKYQIRPSDYPQAWKADWLTLALPLFADLSPDEQGMICERIGEIWRESC